MNGKQSKKTTLVVEIHERSRSGGGGAWHAPAGSKEPGNLGGNRGNKDADWRDSQRGK
jgi:hypothetical protein